MEKIIELRRVKDISLWLIFSPILIFFTTLLFASLFLPETEVARSICRLETGICGKYGVQIIYNGVGLALSSIWHVFLIPAAFGKYGKLVGKHARVALLIASAQIAVILIGLWINFNMQDNLSFTNLAVFLSIVTWLLVVRHFLQENISTILNSEILKSLTASLNTGDVEERKMAAEILVESENSEAKMAIYTGVNSQDATTREIALAAQKHPPVRSALSTGFNAGWAGSILALVLYPVILSLIGIAKGGEAEGLVLLLWFFLYIPIAGIPLVPFTIPASILGALVGVRLNNTRKNTVAGALVGLLVGGIVFLLLLNAPNSFVSNYFESIWSNIS